ncbi:uncharacterized protein LOC144253508 isoform X1 [Urocitellus parryii]
MDVSGQETDWLSAAFRQKLVSQIEDAKRKAGVGHSVSSKEMENHVFLKAKTRDEYLSLVAGLIIHFRDIRKFITWWCTCFVKSTEALQQDIWLSPPICRDKDWIETTHDLWLRGTFINFGPKEIHIFSALAFTAMLLLSPHPDHPSLPSHLSSLSSRE